MKKCAFLALLLALPCPAGADKKPKPLPMPPAVSHNEPISKYACMFAEEPATSVDQYTYWRVVAYVEYGSAHQRYWTKPLGTFRGTLAITSHNSESAGSGAPIGLVHETDYLPDAEKKCAEWKRAVHEMVAQSQKK